MDRFRRTYWTADHTRTGLSSPSLISGRLASFSDWGYGKYYKPTYEKSLKKRLYQELGGRRA
jgi:hypothetical protein